MPRIAKLNNVDLPPQFSYKPYVPQKRNTVTQTFGGVITQAPNPQIVHGDGSLPWSIEACYPTEFKTLYDLYNTTTPTEYEFIGYWGEVLTVLFSQLDQPSVRATLFQVSGQFQVVAVTTPYTLNCGG